MSSSPTKRPASEAIVAGGVVVLLVALVAAVFASGIGQSLYPPDAATAQARDVSGLYDIVMAIAVAIFVIVEGLIIWSILRYRRRSTDTELPPQTHGNNLVEVLWTLIPTVIVLYLFAISWQTLNKVDAISASPDIRIHAIAGQFQWQFEYLDANGKHVATQTIPLAADGGGMAVPVGVKVYVTLDSPDVIHAWYVPRFLFKRDVIPGQTNHFEFTVDESEAGQVFHGQCAELCGTGHRVMLFNVVALSKADYDAWLAKLVQKENATPAPAASGATILQVTAKDVAYDKHDLTVPANAPFAIEFTNNDPAGLPHDIDIHASDGSLLQNQDTLDGGKKVTYNYQPLAAGTYQYICSVHPTVPGMRGTLTVQ